MKITKIGHSCMLIEEGEARMLIDPGVYSTGQNEVMDIDAIFITHEHLDHADPESIKKILVNNPSVPIYTNDGVGAMLRKENIPYHSFVHGQTISIKGIPVEGYGLEHAVIYPTIPIVQNTGFFIANRFFYPGDALYIPAMPVEILALPVAAPWMRLSEAIDYAKMFMPKICFPVHDGMLKQLGSVHRLPQQILESFGVQFMVLDEGAEYEF